jgi:hypothetical protein
MAKMILRRLPEGGFELSGGPLRFRNEQDLHDMCVQIERYPRLLFWQEGRNPERVLEPMAIDDECP